MVNNSIIQLATYLEEEKLNQIPTSYLYNKNYRFIKYPNVKNKSKINRRKYRTKEAFLTNSGNSKAIKGKKRIYFIKIENIDPTEGKPGKLFITYKGIMVNIHKI